MGTYIPRVRRGRRPFPPTYCLYGIIPVGFSRHASSGRLTRGIYVPIRPAERDRRLTHGIYVPRPPGARRTPARIKAKLCIWIIELSLLCYLARMSAPCWGVRFRQEEMSRGRSPVKASFTWGPSCVLRLAWLKSCLFALCVVEIPPFPAWRGRNPRLLRLAWQNPTFLRLACHTKRICSGTHHTKRDSVGVKQIGRIARSRSLAPGRTRVTRTKPDRPLTRLAGALRAGARSFCARELWSGTGSSRAQKTAPHNLQSPS